MQKIVPFLWFDGQADEAVNFYTSIFKNATITSVTRYGDAGPGPKGSIMSATFELDGQEFYALNGGPMFKFSPAISFFVKCESQEEVDYYWSKLAAGGQTNQCGWLQDKFGVSWQVIPTEMLSLLNDPDPGRAQRATQAMLGMRKIDIAEIRRAADGAGG